MQKRKIMACCWIGLAVVFILHGVCHAQEDTDTEDSVQGDGDGESDETTATPAATVHAADNLLIVGGWNSKQLFLMRSDGVLCNHTIPKFPGKERFIDAGAVYLPNVGVILCGGNFAEADVATGEVTPRFDCFVLDKENLGYGFLIMNDSAVPVSDGDQASSGKLAMTTDRESTVWAFSNADSALYEGKVSLSSSSCESPPCARFSVEWSAPAQLGSSAPTTDPCVVYFHHRVVIINGLDESRAPTRGIFAVDRNRKISFMSSWVLHSPPRAFHACHVLHGAGGEELWLAGGLQHVRAHQEEPEEGKRGDGATFARELASDVHVMMIHASDYEDEEEVFPEWINLVSFGHARASFILASLRTGNNDQQRIFAVGGVTAISETPGPNGTLDVTSYAMTNSSEFLDPDSDEWQPAHDNPWAQRLPALAQATFVVVPADFTKDSTCACVPNGEAGVGNCGDSGDEESEGSRSARSQVQLLLGGLVLSVLSHRQ